MSVAIAVSNHKSGVGKSTTAFNLGAGLAQAGRSVLLVDLDPQSELTKSMGLDPKEFEATIYDALMRPDEHSLERLIYRSELFGMALVPSSPDLMGAETGFRNDFEFDSRFALKELLSPLAGEYDYVLLDCPPLLGVLMANALVAAHAVLVPVELECPSLDAVATLSKVVERLQQTVNPQLEFRVLRTMYRRRHYRRAFKLVERAYPDNMLKTIIPRTVRFPESTEQRMPLIHFDPSHPGSLAYGDLVDEIQALWPKDER